jgi:hypothetical protein
MNEPEQPLTVLGADIRELDGRALARYDVANNCLSLNDGLVSGRTDPDRKLTAGFEILDLGEEESPTTKRGGNRPP